MAELLSVHAQVMDAFANVCGQNPATSPFVAGYQSPLCYRCVGLYVAFAGGVLVRGSPSPPLRAFVAHVAVAVLALALLAGDVFVLQPQLPNNASRLLTGTAVGWALAAVVSDAMQVLSAKPSETCSEGERA